MLFFNIDLTINKSNYFHPYPGCFRFKEILIRFKLRIEVIITEQESGDIQCELNVFPVDYDNWDSLTLRTKNRYYFYKSPVSLSQNFDVTFRVCCDDVNDTRDFPGIPTSDYDRIPPDHIFCKWNCLYVPVTSGDNDTSYHGFSSVLGSSSYNVRLFHNFFHHNIHETITTTRE
jgi:hypothetical protein